MDFKGTQARALKLLKTQGLEPEYGIIEITCEGLANHMQTYAYKLYMEQNAINSELLEALQELVMLMEDVRTGNYSPDIYTNQPAKKAINKALGQ